MYKIVENADGTTTVRQAFSGQVVGTHDTLADARIWIATKDLEYETAQQAADNGMDSHCHYCCLPTVKGACQECGTEI